MMAPPTIAATNSPEPSPVSGPRPSIASVKMVGNITELNKPTAMIVHIATWPKVSIDAATRTAAIKAATPRILFGEIFCCNPEPIKRNKAGRYFLRNVANVGLAEVIHQKASDRNFRPNVDENSDCAENQVAVAPNRIMYGAISLLDRGDARQLEQSNGDTQGHQCERKDQIR